MTHFSVARARPILAVFAKLPRQGEVKTRMTPTLTPSEAAAFYQCMLDDVLHASASMAIEHGLDAVLLAHPPEALSAMSSRAPSAFRVVAQRGTDLSARMEWAAAECSATGAPFFLLRGSDSPAMPRRCIAAAVDALQDEADLVVSPDADGGYNLVGMRRHVKQLFAHAMSTADVLADTIANAKHAGMTVERLPATSDLDVPSDVASLKACTRADAELCARTLAFVASNDALNAVFFNA